MNIDSDHRITGHSGNSRGHGPFLDLSLQVLDGRVREATFETYQCPGAHACGKGLCELIRGKTLVEAHGLTYPVLVERVGPLPAHRRQCYGLALLALSDALAKLRRDDYDYPEGTD